MIVIHVFQSSYCVRLNFHVFNTEYQDAPNVARKEQRSSSQALSR